jgi:hypothetical protein
VNFGRFNPEPIPQVPLAAVHFAKKPADEGLFRSAGKATRSNQDGEIGAGMKDSGVRALMLRKILPSSPWKTILLGDAFDRPGLMSARSDERSGAITHNHRKSL